MTRASTIAAPGKNFKSFVFILIGISKRFSWLLLVSR
jgi:hypothetical protein